MFLVPTVKQPNPGRILDETRRRPSQSYSGYDLLSLTQSHHVLICLFICSLGVIQRDPFLSSFRNLKPPAHITHCHAAPSFLTSLFIEFLRLGLQLSEQRIEGKGQIRSDQALHDPWCTNRSRIDGKRKNGRTTREISLSGGCVGLCVAIASMLSQTLCWKRTWLKHTQRTVLHPDQDEIAFDRSIELS